MMHLLRGMSSAPIFEDGEYMDPGWYDLSIVRCLMKQTQRSGVCFIAELEVVASSVAKHGSGHKVSWLQKMSDLNIALPSIKQFTLAAMGIPKSNPQAVAWITPALDNVGEWAVSSHNVLSGWKIHTDNQHTTTRQGKTFTKHSWDVFNYEHYQLPAPDLQGLYAQCLNPPPPEAPVAARPAYVPSGAPPAYGAPPPVYAPPVAAPPPYVPPAPPRAPAGPPGLPPGAQVSPDGAQYWAPGMAGWAPIPGRG